MAGVWHRCGVDPGVEVDVLWPNIRVSVRQCSLTDLPSGCPLWDRSATATASAEQCCSCCGHLVQPAELLCGYTPTCGAPGSSTCCLHCPVAPEAAAGEGWRAQRNYAGVPADAGSGAARHIAPLSIRPHAHLLPTSLELPFSYSTTFTSTAARQTLNIHVNQHFPDPDRGRGNRCSVSDLHPVRHP